jgi:hypothetical protein
MKRRPYAGEITKDYLMKLGVEYVSTDGKKVIVNGKDRRLVKSSSGKNKHYLALVLYDADLRANTPKEERKISTGQVNIGVHVLNYVWNKADKAQGYVIDHIDNDPFNNDISNLQCITPKENVNKNRTTEPRKVKMPSYITEEAILRKLEGYEMAYEQAKADHDAKAAHALRCLLSEWRSKHRQFLEDPERYSDKSKKHIKNPELPCHTIAAQRKVLKAKVESARKYYKEMRDAYGKADSYVKKLYWEWMLAVAELKVFQEENKQDRYK